MTIEMKLAAWLHFKLRTNGERDGRRLFVDAHELAVGGTVDGQDEVDEVRNGGSEFDWWLVKTALLRRWPPSLDAETQRRTETWRCPREWKSIKR